MPNVKNEQSKCVLTVTLNPSVDSVLLYQSFNNYLRFKKQFDFGAGKGVNVSRALEALGIQTVTSGLVGGRNGEQLTRLLEREKLANQFVLIKANSRKNISLCADDGVVFQRLFQQSPAIDTSEIERFMDLYRQLMKQSRLVVLSGRLPAGLDQDMYYELIRQARVGQVKVCLDTSGLALRRGLKAKPWMIKPNRHEVYEALGIKINKISDGIQALKIFRRKGIKNVLISLGAQGAIGCNHDDLWYAKASNVKAMTSVGCGDALVAGFCAEYLAQASFQEALRFAVAAGTINTQSVIPGGIHSDGVRKLAKSIKLTKIKI